MPERGERGQSNNTAIHCTTGCCAAMSREGQVLIAALSREPSINAKMVAKWRKWEAAEDLTTGPREPHSTLLTKPGHLW